MTGAASRVLITDQVFGGTTIERGVLEPLGVEVVEAPSADEATLVRLAEEIDWDFLAGRFSSRTGFGNSRGPKPSSTGAR